MADYQNGELYAAGCDVFVAPRRTPDGWHLGPKLATADTPWNAAVIAYRCRHFVALLQAAEAVLDGADGEAAQAVAALRAIVRACREDHPSHG
jgi:hypothetical protein